MPCVGLKLAIPCAGPDGYCTSKYLLLSETISVSILFLPPSVLPRQHAASAPAKQQTVGVACEMGCGLQQWAWHVKWGGVGAQQNGWGM